jgi:hypothetical protein
MRNGFALLSRRNSANERRRLGVAGKTVPRGHTSTAIPTHPMVTTQLPNLHLPARRLDLRQPPSRHPHAQHVQTTHPTVLLQRGQAGAQLVHGPLPTPHLPPPPLWAVLPVHPPVNRGRVPWVLERSRPRPRIPQVKLRTPRARRRTLQATHLIPQVTLLIPPAKHPFQKPTGLASRPSLLASSRRGSAHRSKAAPGALLVGRS